MRIRTINKISPCLWFNGKAEEAARFYTSVFKNSRITNIAYRTESVARMSGLPKGSVLAVSFTLDGQEFLALNGGPDFPFTQAISLMVSCKTQKEVDYFWKKLSKGGDKTAQMCGWLKDKFGLSWQIVPNLCEQVLKDKDPSKVDRFFTALGQMKKLDIKKLEKAYRN